MLSILKKKYYRCQFTKKLIIRNSKKRKIEVKWDSITKETWIRYKGTWLGGWKELTLKNCNPKYKYKQLPKSMKQAIFFAVNSSASN
jgi:hypothetical protein